MLAVAALCLSGAASGFAYFSGSGYLNARPSQNVWNLPSPIENVGRIKDISTGYDHALALKPDGTVLSWGSNAYGQLGRTGTSEPAPIPGLPPIMKIAAGTSVSLAVATDGRVYGWGANGAGQLGTGALKRQKTPVQVYGASNIADVSVGYGHVLALKTDGSLVAWGTNTNGVLGDGTTTNRFTPAPVPGLSSIVDFDADALRSIAVRDDGTLFAWGYNYNDWLAVGSSETSIKQPSQVLDISNVVAADTAVSHTLAIRADGKVFSWGSNAETQLGNPNIPATFAGINRPQEIPGLSDIASVNCAGYANVALTSAGGMYLFGYTNYWATPFKSAEPILVPNLPPVAAASAHTYNTLALVDTEIPFWVSLNPTYVVGGFGTSTYTVHTEEVLDRDVAFNLSSTDPNATAPATVTLPAGQAEASVVVKAPTIVNQPIAPNIVAETNGYNAAANLYIDIRRLTLYISPELQAGSPGSGQVKINFPAPKAGIVVTLTSSNPDRLSVPASVTIPAGETLANFSIQSAPGITDAYVPVTAQQGSRRSENGVLIKGTWLTNLAIDKTEVYGGQAVKVTVTLPQPAPAGGLLLELLPWPEELQVGDYRRVPEGATSTVVRVGTYPVTQETGGALTIAAPNSYPKWVSWKILPPYLKTAAFSPMTVQGGTNATLKVTLNSLSAGETVSLYSTSTAVQLPAGVEVPAGAKEATISIPTNTVTANANAWVRCRLRDKTIWIKLVVTP